MSSYDLLGVGYGAVRRPDWRIAQVRAALGEVGPVINVDADLLTLDTYDAGYRLVLAEPHRF